MAKTNRSPADYEKLAEGLEYMREALRAMVAGLMEDGFSEEQARELSVAVFTRDYGDEDE